jgi:chromosome segregation ATPase
MAWFRGEKRAINDRIITLRVTMDNYEKAQAEHVTQIAVLETCQKNTEARLDTITEVTGDTNRKIDGLHDTLTDVLLTLKRR